VDGATAAGGSQYNLSVAQRDYVPGRDGADEEGRVGPGDGGCTKLSVAERVEVIQEISNDSFWRCSGCVDGRVVEIGDRFGD
jgi:hypothetical protein